MPKKKRELLPQPVRYLVEGFDEKRRVATGNGDLQIVTSQKNALIGEWLPHLIARENGQFFKVCGVIADTDDTAALFAFSEALAPATTRYEDAIEQICGDLYRAGIIRAVSKLGRIQEVRHILKEASLACQDTVKRRCGATNLATVEDALARLPDLFLEACGRNEPYVRIIRLHDLGERREGGDGSVLMSALREAGVMAFICMLTNPPQLAGRREEEAYVALNLLALIETARARS